MQKSIESIQNQIYKNFEVLIIDGGSDKETQEFLKGLHAPFFYQSKKDDGIYNAMNNGISLSKGEWLYFLGAGDVLFDAFVLENVFQKKSIEQSNLISGKIIYKGTIKPFIYSKNKVTQNPSWNSFMWIRNGLHHQGTFYKKVLFHQQNLPESYKILSDYWFNLKAFKNGEKCTILQTTIAICNSDGVSKSGNWHLYQEEIRLKTNLSSILFTPLFYIIAFTKFLTRKIIHK